MGRGGGPDGVDLRRRLGNLLAGRLVLLRHKVRRERPCFFAAQQGQRESLATSSMMSRRRSVGIELGT